MSYVTEDSRYYALCAEVLAYVEENGRSFSNTGAITRAMTRLFWAGCRSLDDVLSIDPSEMVGMHNIGPKSVFIITGVYPDNPYGTTYERDREIRRYRRCGWTFNELSTKYGLTEQRIKVICQEGEFREQRTAELKEWAADMDRKQRIQDEMEAQR